MARSLSKGTPSRTKRYVMPAGGRMVLWCLVAGLVGLGLAGGLHVAGIKRVASPGTVAAGHAGIDTRCAQCHQPKKAALDLRCERCHDPVDSRRYETPAHALVGGGSAWHGANATPQTCATCHGEHRGAAASLKTVDDRRCAVCHTFASFNKHPEFAAHRAGRGPDEGMSKFSHEIHLREIAKTGGDRCQSCHRLMSDRVGFEPIAFDGQCARCHIKNNFLTLNGIDPLASGPTYPGLLSESAPGASAPEFSEPGSRGRITFTGVSHRDPWVRINADRLSRTLSAEAWNRNRSRLLAEQATLIAIRSAIPLSEQSEQNLAKWQMAVSQEAVELAADGDPSGAAAIAAAVAAIDPSAASLAAQLRGKAAPASDRAAPADARSIEERRQELQQLIDAIAARTNGPLAARAAELTQRLASMAADTAPPPPDLQAIGERLNEVESALQAAAPLIPGDALIAIEAARDAVRQQLTGAVDQATYDARRSDLLKRIDQLSARGDDVGRARIAELRAAVLSLPEHAGTPSPGRDRARLLERIGIELGLRGDPGPGTAAVVTTMERRAADEALARVNARLSALDALPRPIANADPAQVKSSIAGVLGACMSCHHLTPDGAGLRRIAINTPVMPSSVFSHKPHVGQAQCESCHTSIASSKAAEDVNVPALATCQSCHRPRQARSDCAECHTYHPRSAADMVVARWR